MVDRADITRSLEELRLEMAGLQARTDGAGESFSQQVAEVVVRLNAALDWLREAQVPDDRAGDRVLTLQHAVSRMLLAAPDLAVIAPHLLQTISEHLGWSCGVLWIVQAEQEILTCQGFWSAPSAATTELARATQHASLAPLEDLPGRVWTTGDPIWQPNIRDASSAHLSAAAEAGLCSVLAVPIRGSSATLGVIELLSSELYVPDTGVLHAVATIGSQIGLSIERQRAEYERMTAQTRLALILQQIPAGVIIAEAPSGRLILGNPQVEQIWRHPFLHSASIEDYHQWSGFHPDGRPYQPAEWPLARAITTGAAVIGEEIVLARGDGTRGVARVNAAPIRDSSGQIIAGVVLLDDITAERKAVERALQLQTISAALAEALTPAQVAQVIVSQGVTALDAYAGSLAILTADGTELEMLGVMGYPAFVNQAFQRFSIHTQLPIPVSVRTGQPVFIEDIALETETYPALASITAQTISRALVALPLRVKDRVFGAIGLSFRQPQVFNAEERTFMLTLAGQCALALERARLYAAELEARQRAEAAQRRLELLAQASQILASSLDYETTLAHVVRLALPVLADWSAVALLTDDGQLNVVTQAHVDPEKEVLLREYLHRYPSDPNATSGMPRVMRTGVSQLTSQITPEMWSAANMEAEPVELLQALGFTSYMCVPLRTADQTLGALSFMSSRPDRLYTADDLALAEELGRRGAVAIQNARLYHEAQAAIRLRDEFLSMASHELRTPLTSLLGTSQVVQRRIAHSAGSDERVQRGITVIARQAERLRLLIDQMFDLSRVQMGHLNLEMQPLDVSILIGRSVEEIQPLLQRHTVTLLCPETPLPVLGDETRLEQVIQNMLHNALKYSPDGGPITVRALQHEQTVQIAVTDAGIGIPEAAHEHIFKRFYRASNTAQRNISGLGIGLYIVDEIIQRHGGNITVQSAENQGTTFTMTLPLLTPSAGGPTA